MRRAKKESDFIPLREDDVKHSVSVDSKPIDDKDIIKIEKQGKKKKIRKTKKKSKATKTLKPAILKPKPLKEEGYVLVITEKPQAAEKIAAALSNGKDKKISKPGGVAYFELKRNNANIIVACAVGHLFSVSQTKKGTDYPIFDIGWFPNYEVRRKDFTKKYYDTINKLAKDASEIVVATDFDIEGEVIGYNVVRFIAHQKDAKRMKFSALTAGEIQNAYDKSLPTIQWGQAIAGETRHFLDWLYGINLSRALMNAIKTTGKFKIMSIGRVQGPTLHLIVDKEKQIQAFKPKPYWQIFMTINDTKNQLELKHNKDITQKKDLTKFKKLEGEKTEAKTKKTEQTIMPPAPFDLTTLQTEAYKFHGITPSNTLRSAQSLYLKGIISYPRTSSQKIPDSIEPDKILKKLEKKFAKLTKQTTRSRPIEGNKSDPAHPAIIPTGTYGRMNDYDEKIYNLIVKRFISCYCDDAKLANKRVEIEIDKLKFYTKGIEILQAGWINVYPIKIDEREIQDFNGEVTINKIKTEEKQTKPPNRYSPASILRELEKKNLGTKATRSNILETLYSRNYIKDKQIKATVLGIRLIDSLEKHSPIIIDEKLTREIEKDMDNIKNSKKDLIKKQKDVVEKAEEALTNISKDFKSKEKQIGKELVAANEALWAQQKEENKLNIKCPGCKKGELTLKYTPRFKSYFVACTSYPECKQTFSLPSQSLVKKVGKDCEECKWPKLIRFKQGRRPWIFCFNPDCLTNEEWRKKAEAKKRRQEEKEENKV